MVKDRFLKSVDKFYDDVIGVTTATINFERKKINTVIKDRKIPVTGRMRIVLEKYSKKNDRTFITIASKYGQTSASKINGRWYITPSDETCEDIGEPKRFEELETLKQMKHCKSDMREQVGVMRSWVKSKHPESFLE